MDDITNQRGVLHHQKLLLASSGSSSQKEEDLLAATTSSSSVNGDDERSATSSSSINPSSVEQTSILDGPYAKLESDQSDVQSAGGGGGSSPSSRTSLSQYLAKNAEQHKKEDAIRTFASMEEAKAQVKDGSPQVMV